MACIRLTPYVQPSKDSKTKPFNVSTPYPLQTLIQVHLHVTIFKSFYNQITTCTQYVARLGIPMQQPVLTSTLNFWSQTPCQAVLLSLSFY